MAGLTLRNATKEDAGIVFEWRNDPWIIQKGSLNKTVTWEEHEKWFLAFLSNPMNHMFIIELEEKPIGQVRFSGSNQQDYAEISTYILKDYIGKGRGVEAIKESCGIIKSILNVRFIIAYILKENIQSIRAFEKAGFASLEISDMKNLGLEQKPDHAIYKLTVSDENSSQ
jgi:RimJ/RimL family protein N-acetyltransferase